MTRRVGARGAAEDTGDGRAPTTANGTDPAPGRVCVGHPVRPAVSGQGFADEPDLDLWEVFSGASFFILIEPPSQSRDNLALAFDAVRRSAIASLLGKRVTQAMGDRFGLCFAGSDGRKGRRARR